MFSVFFDWVSPALELWEGRLCCLDPAEESRLEVDVKMKGLRIGLSLRASCWPWVHITVECPQVCGDAVRMPSYQHTSFRAQSLLFPEATRTQVPMFLHLQSPTLPVKYFGGLSASWVKSSLELNVYRIKQPFICTSCHFYEKFMVCIRL